MSEWSHRDWSQEVAQPSGPGAGQADGVSTGHPVVDATVQALREASHASPADQIPAFQAAHRTLRETLASIDES